MSYFDRYIMRSLVLCMLVVLMCIVVLMILFGFIDEARGTDETRSFLEVVSIVVLRVPLQLSEVVPFVIFLGAVIGFGSLNANSEITILRSSGVSPWRLSGSALMAGLLVFLSMWIVTEFLGPRAMAVAAQLEQSEASERSGRGYWYREGNVFTKLMDVDDGGRLADVMQFEFDVEGRLTRATTATGGIPLEESNSWQLTGVAETTFDTLATITATSQRRIWLLNSDFSSFGARLKQEPSALSIFDLRRHIDHLKTEGMNASQFQIAFWSRLLNPLGIVGLLLIAVGFVLGPMRETGMGSRITGGIGIGVLFGYLQQALAPLAMLYSSPPLLAVLTPIAITLGVGTLLLRRLR